MDLTRRPHLHTLAHHGTIQGVTISTSARSSDLCHYFGGVRYALPPLQRWRRARRLPPDYRYGSEEHPARCDGGAGVCPQPGFMSLSPPDEGAWTEDCFQCNVWVPMGLPPRGGWPVMVYLRMFPFFLAQFYMECIRSM